MKFLNSNFSKHNTKSEARSMLHSLSLLGSTCFNLDSTIGISLNLLYSVHVIDWTNVIYLWIKVISCPTIRQENTNSKLPFSWISLYFANSHHCRRQLVFYHLIM